VPLRLPCRRHTPSRAHLHACTRTRQVAEGAAGPMFPDETCGLPVAWDYYGEVLDPEEWPEVDAPDAAGGRACGALAACAAVAMGGEALLRAAPGLWPAEGGGAARLLLRSPPSPLALVLALTRLACCCCCRRRQRAAGA
jgi:hypothetical protein